MGSSYSGASVTSFPQTLNNRSLDALKDELASFSGGQTRKDILKRAQEAIFEAVYAFNATPWTFNRVTEDITLVAAQSEYTLSSNWRNPLRAQMVDSSSKTRDTVEWLPWVSWVSRFPDQSTTGSIPLMYTAFNIHETGQITVDPVPASTLTYPTLRLFYHRRIEVPSNGADILEVPQEVEQAIFDEAIWRFLRKMKTFREAKDAQVAALLSRSAITFEYADFEDYYGS